MRTRPTLSAALLLAACGGGTPAVQPAPDEAVLLRLAPPAGLVSHYVTDMTTTVDMPGNPMLDSAMTMRQEMYMTQTVVEAEGSTRRYSMTIDSVHLDAPGMFGMSAEMGDMMKGSMMETAMTTRGEILEVGADSGGLADIMQRLGGAQDLIGGLSLGLPEAPVRPGATWSVPVDKTIDLAEMGTIRQTMELAYRLDRVETRAGARHAMLSFTGTMDQALDTADEALGMGMHYAGDLSGTMDLDLDAGRLGGMSMDMSMDGTLDVMGQSMKMFMTMAMEQVLLEDTERGF